MTRNLVLVTLDSLRADHCGPTARGEDLAPTLRRMARDGVEYEYAVAPGPRTPSSMPAIFTGEHVRPVDGETGDFWERRRAVIREHMGRHRPLSERLQERGYHTIGVTVNPWTQDTGFDRGFDEFVHVSGGTLGDYGPPTFRLADRVLDGSAVGDRLYWFNKREWFIRWPDFYETVRERVRDAPEPYFLWVFLLDTHQPYVVPAADRRESSALGMYYASFRELATSGTIPPWVRTRLGRAYRDSVRSVDRFLARLLADTAADDPVVVVHSDHGEAFGEHGTYGHEQELYEENLRVPFVVHNGPDREPVRDPFPVRRLPDVVESLATPASFDPDGFTAEFVVSAVDDGHATAVTTGEWKLIRGRSDPELYDLVRDPGERTNLASRRGAVAAELGAVLDRHGSHRAERERIASAVRERATALDGRR